MKTWCASFIFHFHENWIVYSFTPVEMCDFCLIAKFASPFQESEIARLQAKISGLERASELHSFTLHHASISPLKDALPSVTPSHIDPVARSSISSTSWKEASSDVSLELPESLKASVKAVLELPSSPCWQGLSNTELSSSSDMTFNPLTYMLDAEEPEESHMDSLSGMLRFVNQTLALQEQHMQVSSRSQDYAALRAFCRCWCISVLCLNAPGWRRISRGRVITGSDI